MLAKDFEMIFEDCVKLSRETLIEKGKEYATEDRLHNFKQAGAMQMITPEEALLGMLTKHIVSVFDMVRSKRSYSIHKWNEKIGDAINYLILLKALTMETSKAILDDPQYSGIDIRGEEVTDPKLYSTNLPISEAIVNRFDVPVPYGVGTM